MPLVTIRRPAGTAAVRVDVVGGGGSDVPAGPCEVQVEAALVAAIPGAIVVAPDAPGDPAEE